VRPGSGVRARRSRRRILRLGPEPGPIDAVAISALTLAELHVGVLVATSEPTRAERLCRLGVIETTLDGLPVNDAVARQ
jgi:hypothetical protein